LFADCSSQYLKNSNHVTMPLRRLLAVLFNNPHLIETLSETKFMRRAAQITVGLYNSFMVCALIVFQKISIVNFF